LHIVSRFTMILLITISFLLVLAGCGKDEKPSAQVKVGMMPITDNLPFWVAESKGYFAEEGVEVELIPFPSALERDSAFLAEQIDAGIGDLLAVAAMNNAGTEVRAVAVGQGAVPGENRFAVLSAPDSGITNPEQLKNVPIALSLNTINEYITGQLLLDKGLKPEDFKTNSMPKLPIRLEALLNGQVQAATLPDPFATLAEIKGANLVLDNTGNTVAQTVVIVRKETLEGNLEGLKKLMRAYSRAVEDLQADPLQYEDILAESVRVPQEVLASTEHPLRLHFSKPEMPDREGVSEVVQWMKEHNLLQKDLGYDDLVDGRVIEK